jgi:hypothetical protein
MEKRNKIIYWIATALFAFGMLQSGIGAVLRLQIWVDIAGHLGYPLYFLSILGIWKILGVIAILIPGFKLVKEWAYAGFFFVMTGALISHLILGDGGKAILGPIMQTAFIVLSWYFRPADRRIISVN